METKGKPEKVWTLTFFLLWQGQLVSILGDVSTGSRWDSGFSP